MHRDLATSGIGMTSMRTRTRMVESLRVAGITDERVLDAILQTPRHLFVDAGLAPRAYHNTALPIAKGQTISQPYIVARMTELLMSGRERVATVLEVGTGCGYQTAILAKCCVTVYSVERDNDLLREARKRLSHLGIHNVVLANRDGFAGWPQHAPFEAILGTAAPATLPPALPQQLAESGRLVMPLGADGVQYLCAWQRSDGDFTRQTHEPVMFVPMVEGVVS